VHYKFLGPSYNPRNLNDAPEPVFTNILSDADKLQKGVGQWDTRWKGF
jgi:hypothetical protein